MSPLGEAYRRARGGRSEAGEQEARQAQGKASSGAERPSGARAFASPQHEGEGLRPAGPTAGGASGDILSRASRVSAFAEGALRPGCDELAGLRAAIYAAGLDRPPATILVASHASGSGTTAVAVGLAGELARDLSRRVIIVDADVRSPGVASALGAEAAYGLADVLGMRAEAGRAILHSEVDNLSALVLRPDPVTGTSMISAQLLAGPAANEAFDAIQGAFDYVVIDAGATEESAAARVVACRATGVVLVLPVGVTRARARAARSALESAGGRTLGVVLTGGGPR